MAALRTKLIPLASLITPNLPEAAALLDEPIAANEAEIEARASGLLAMGARAVLIKGGHGKGARASIISSAADGVVALAAPRIATKNTHGTGCSLSSAIAAGLAKGETWKRRAQCQGLGERGDCRGRSPGRRSRPWTDPSFPRVRLMSHCAPLPLIVIALS